MDVVRSLADRIVVLHNGLLVADGDPAAVIASPIVQEAYLGMEGRADERGAPHLDGVHTHIGPYHILHGVTSRFPPGELTICLAATVPARPRSCAPSWVSGRRRPARSVSTVATSTTIATPDIARAGIAYVPESMGIFYRSHRAREYRAGGAQRPRRANRLEWMLGLFPALKRFWTLPAGNLSGGQKQMLAIARAIAEPRRLLLVDEPTKGLAPVMVRSMIEAFRALKEAGETILLVEQNFHRRVGAWRPRAGDG